MWRVRRRLMVPERVELPYALSARDIVSPEELFRRIARLLSSLFCPVLGGSGG